MKRYIPFDEPRKFDDCREKIKPNRRWILLNLQGKFGILKLKRMVLFRVVFLLVESEAVCFLNASLCIYGNWKTEETRKARFVLDLSFIYSFIKEKNNKVPKFWFNIHINLNYFKNIYKNLNLFLKDDYTFIRNNYL